MTDRKLRVLFIDHTAVLSGGELAMLAILRHIDRTRHECAVLLGSHGPLVAELQGLAPVHVLPMSRRLLDTRKQTLHGVNFAILLRVLFAIPYIWQIFRFIRRWKPDLVHTNSLKSDILAGIAARLAGVPLIWHVRDRIDPDYLPAKAVFGFRLLCRFIPHSVIGCSQAVLDTLHLPASKPRTVVYSGVAMQPLTPRDPEKATTIGLIGRLAPWKGQHVFLAATATLRQSFPNVRIVLLGSAMFGEQDYEDSLHALVETLHLGDIVEFRGFVRAIEREIAGLDIVVHASTSAEPFGQTIVQGMAAGKPVIATRGGGASEIVRDGFDGLLVDRGDVPQLAAALHRLLADPGFAQSLAEQGRLRVQQKFTIQQTINALSDAFGTVVRVPDSPTRILFANATGSAQHPAQPARGRLSRNRHLPAGEPGNPAQRRRFRAHPDAGARIALYQ
jgi:glycosyltransferase involved in cell wall biosynthesis